MKNKVTLICSILFLVFSIGGIVSMYVEGMKIIGQISCLGLIAIMIVLLGKSFMDKRKYDIGPHQN